ncbi:ABC transporter ATP-binding protein [Aeromonas veronii]
MSCAISLEGLTKRFGERVALNAISATIPAGGITGLVGPDGAGKSTLLRLLAGLLIPEAGTIRVLGLDPVSEGDLLRQRLGYMPQQFGLYEDLSVLENLTLYADLRGVLEPERTPTFARLLAFTDLARFTARPAGKLSGGMKQKLGLACALLGTPDVLLLDEPGVGVDPISRRALWQMVRELAKGGITVIWSTAYLDEAELCDHVLLMADGEVRTSGTPADLMGAMASRCWLLEAGQLDGRERRALLRRALAHPAVMDGAVAGERVRLLLHPGIAPTAGGAATDQRRLSTGSAPAGGCLYRPARRRPRRGVESGGGDAGSRTAAGGLPRGGDRGAPPHQALRRFCRHR